jgi:hypothetical protein
MDQWWFFGEYVLFALFFLLAAYVSGRRHQLPMYFRVYFWILVPFSILWACATFYLVFFVWDRAFAHSYLLLFGLIDLVPFGGWLLERWSWRREQRSLNKVVS